jgi:hypothetical protein
VIEKAAHTRCAIFCQGTTSKTTKSAAPSKGYEPGNFLRQPAKSKAHKAVGHGAEPIPCDVSMCE